MIQLDSSSRISNLQQALGSSFLEIENPARYLGSEYYFGRKAYSDGDIKCAMCFPDLYEIGMCNNAVRIIYDLLNRIDGTFCDRVFAVAPDFEKLLRDFNVPLYTLQEHFPLNKLDYLGITISYELSATNILQVLDLGGIQIEASKRSESDPIVFAGGPASTNPLPFAKFFDFFYVGEAESDMADIIEILKKYKKRNERIEHLKEIPCLWYPGKKLAIRAVDTTFGTSAENPLLQHFVVPAFQVAQDHATVEIMRGCPNGCRFCHAGQYYKPFRQRNLSTVYNLVKQNVDQFGYREVTLSSLSSGDYPDLDKLIATLNGNFKHRNVSFSLPSLKVSSFSLGILEQLSEVRKSSLTFAIETPVLEDQRSMNKEVPVEQIINIIQEAKSRGWRLAKFYFMVGLPFVDRDKEEENIVNFLSQIRSATKINMNINIGTFIPKVHTPFQWVKQMSMEESGEHLRSIKKALMLAIPGIKVSYHEPKISFLEGIVSRGGYECADLIQRAYELGCRLDAWDEHVKWDMWQQAIAELNYDVAEKEWSLDEELPWDSVSMNVSKAYLKKEYLKARDRQLTPICNNDCDHHCGVCGKKARVVKAQNEDLLPAVEVPTHGPYVQTVFTYEKKGRAVYCSHIAVMRQFEMAFQRSGLDIQFTQGFNPKPKMEFLNPITMGVKGERELLLCELPLEEVSDVNVVNRLNTALAEGFIVTSVKVLPSDPTGKKISLASKMLGSVYEICNIKDPELESILQSRLTEEHPDYIISYENGTYTIKIHGDKNLFKTVFSPDINKFHIAGSCDITRKYIEMETL